jgi:hypothetical protein
VPVELLDEDLPQELRTPRSALRGTAEGGRGPHRLLRLQVDPELGHGADVLHVRLVRELEALHEQHGRLQQPLLGDERLEQVRRVLQVLATRVRTSAAHAGVARRARAHLVEDPDHLLDALPARPDLDKVRALVSERLLGVEERGARGLDLHLAELHVGEEGRVLGERLRERLVVRCSGGARERAGGRCGRARHALSTEDLRDADSMLFVRRKDWMSCPPSPSSSSSSARSTGLN